MQQNGGDVHCCRHNQVIGRSQVRRLGMCEMQWDTDLGWGGGLGSKVATIGGVVGGAARAALRGCGHGQLARVASALPHLPRRARAPASPQSLLSQYIRSVLLHIQVYCGHPPLGGCLA